MNCREVRERFELVEMGGAGHGEAEEVRRHLASCRECSAYVEDVKRTGELLRQFVSEEVEKVPENAVLSRVEASIREEREKKIFPRFLTRLAPVIVGLLALAAVMFYSSIEEKPSRVASFDVTVESVEAVNATVVLVNKGEDSPKVIWIIEREET